MKRSSHPLASLFHARSSRRAAALIVLALVLSSLPISSRAAAPQATLQIDAPAQVAVGQPIELALTVRAAADLAGFEAAVDFDTAVAEFAGLDRRSSGLARTGRDVGALTIPELPGGSVIALYSCPAASCVDGSGPQQPLGASGDVALATFDILPLRPGTLEIALDPLKFVDAASNPTPVAVPNHTIVVQVGPPGAGPRYPAPGGPWALGQAAAAPASLDLTGDGLVSHADLMEVALAWTRAREHGRVCGALVDSSRDVNGDGCVDVADLQLLATRYSPAGQGAPPQVEAAAPLTLVVNSTGDTGDAQIGDGVCKTSAGSCTLRAAIQEANAHAGPDQINFAISGTGVHTIQLGAELPALNDTSGGTTIDGYSQPGAVPNTDPLVSNTTIHVEVEGEGASGLDALPITSAGNVVRGLAFYNLHRSIWLFGGGAHDNRLIGNFIGTNAAGTFKLTFNTVDALGVHISQGASRNHIGDTAPADRNVISGNARSGVGLWDQGTDDNIIVNNIVGLNPSGTSRLANANHGIDMNFGVSYTIVGGTGPGERNVVSGNQHQGIEISHLASTSYNWVVGNYVGTDVTGKQGPAYARNDGFGIQTKDRVANNLVADNVVGNNQMAGIRVDEYGTCCVGRNQFTNNRVGLGVDGSSIPNRVAGFLITAGNTLVGPGNIIANNPIGVAIDGDASDGNTITHNAIYGNSGLGIDLGPLGMVNQNDQGDGDSGPNQQLNFPVLQSATPSQVSGTSNANTTVEIFVADHGAGAYGEGKTFVGAATAAADGTFSVPINGAAPGDYVTATATSALGNTSEFSLNLLVGAGPAPGATPTIVSLSPSTAPAGGAAFVLTVIGTNFGSSSAVQWNGADRPTSFVNSTRLTAQIAAADIATAGTASVAVINHDSGQHSSAVNFFVNTTAPAPQISRLTPDAAVAGGPAVALTVTGTNFVSGAVVRWNGANRPTSFVSSTQLTAQIAAADIAAASTASVVVANPDGGVSNALPFAINAPEPAPGTNPLFLPLVEKH